MGRFYLCLAADPLSAVCPPAVIPSLSSVTNPPCKLQVNVSTLAKMTPILTQAQLRRLDEHKYSITGMSVMEPVLQVFWNCLVEKLPLWVAPNIITLTGFVISVMTSLCVIYYAPTATEEAPSWAYLASALGWFAFQTLDGIDGKQARRTGSSTPLGEFLDHSNDVVTTVFGTVGFCCALKMGETPEWLFFFFIMAVFSYYCAYWEVYVTEELHFEFIDIAEAQVFAIGVNAISGLLGPSVWSLQMPLLGVRYGAAVSAAVMADILLKVFCCFRTIRRAKLSNGGTTAAGTSVLSPGFPIFCHVAVACSVYMNSSTNLLQNHPCLYLLMVGMATSKISSQIIVARMTKSEMPMFDLSMLGPGLLVLNQCCNCLINEYGLLWVSLIFLTFDLTRYCVLVCMQICDHLDIYCFSITSKPSRKD